MRVVVALDKFKRALSAPDACAAAAAGVRRAAPEAEVELCPMADGGEGTAAALAARGGPIVEREVTGPLPDRRVLGRITLIDAGRTGVIDMSAAAGIALLDDRDLDPERTTTHGVGELVAHALDLGCRTVIVGLGGSATCDGGLGAAQALGLRVTLDDGRPAARPLTGGDLGRVTKLEVPAIGHRGRVVCLCDVDNPLLGDRGTAAVYAPQKGATPRQVRSLEAGLRRLVEASGRAALAGEPGMGAAGGLAFGLSLATKAELRPGVEAVCEACKLDELLVGTQLCLTGEGRFDSQSLAGKVPAGVARHCREAGVPCVVLAGSVEAEAAARAAEHGIAAAVCLADGPATLADLMARTPDLLSAAARQVTRLALEFAPRRP